MLWTVIAGGGGIILLWQFIKPQPKPIDGVYRQPGKWYHVKKFICKLLLKRNQQKNKKKKAVDVESYSSRGYGMGINDIHVLEKVQNLEKDPYAIDAVYYGGFSKEGTRLALRMGRRHNRQSEVWLVMEIPGIGRLQHPLHPDTLVSNVSNNEYTAGGINIEIIEPMKKWKISYNGQLRFDGTERLVHVQMSLIWQTVTDPFSFDTDMNQSALADAVSRELWTKQFWDALRSKHQTHYELWGELHGKVKVDGFDEKFVTLKTIRDHSFGIRDWRTFYRYSIHFIYLENGTMIQVGVVSQPAALSHVKIGYLVHSNGAFHSVSDIDLKLWEVAPPEGPKNNYTFNFYANGKKYTTEVFGEWTPIWYHHKDRGSKVYEKFCKYKINGIDGYGLAEFHYRNPDGTPYSPIESVPMLDEPTEEEIRNNVTDLTLTFQEKGCCSSKLVGGKGAQLGLLTSIQNKVNVVVPKGFCVTLAAFNKQLQINQDISKSVDKIIAILRDGCHDNLKSACSDTVEMIATTAMCSDVTSAITQMLNTVFVDADKTYFAIRSSASGEDGTEASSAGQMETYLGVRGEKEIIDAVRKCWASGFTYQAVQYRRMNGQHIKVCVGVVIQEMVKSEVSGVLFTNHPVTGSANQITLNASYGLGESVVSGKTTPDSIFVNRSWDNQLNIAEKSLGEKQVAMSIKDGGGVIEEKIDRKNTCCMTDEQILQLCHKAIQIENYFGSPRDIEWAMFGGNYYLLQARPITAMDQETHEDMLHEFDDPLVTGREFLTTGNIGEMMPGAVTPLTNSIFKPAINIALLRYAEIMAEGPHLNHPDNIVLSCCGTMFINMTMIETMAINNFIGKKDAAELNLIGQSLDSLSYQEVVDYCGGVPSLWRRLNTFISSFSKYNERTAVCESWYEKVKTYKIGEGQTTCAGFYTDLDSRIKDYYEIWETSMIKSGQSGTWAAVVVGILLQGKTEYTTEVCADVALLLSKCDEVYSAEVPIAIQNLAKEIDKAGCSEKFLSSNSQECVDLIKSGVYSGVKSSFDTFMEHHGHRYVKEAEFYERSWRSQPEKLVKSLKVVLKNKLYSQKPRKTLSCDEAIAQIKTPLPWMAKKILRSFVLPKARKAVGQREWGKSLSIKVADKFKEAYWTLAEMMVKEGRLPEKELLFFLTHTEIGKLIETRSPKLIYKSIRRKKLFPTQMELRFLKMNVGKPVPMTKEDLSAQRTATFSLKGMPVCHGVITGVCRVVKSLPEADDIQAGDILIVLYTDIGWSPYFPLISGLVTEIGGLVSHGAVVAREFGLPCIVNVPNATNMFQSGDHVRLDGQAGTIERLVN
ncbi:rifampicin phosphotransferase-like [Mytilus edulis]|uniref:rifampicin phosphotransferase-like n=1 Tax=Mytilus edulis TaxID=6550 RepID=UPI0039F01224